MPHDPHDPWDILSLVRGVAMLRVELTPTVAPPADHIAWSRLGKSYRPDDTVRAQSQGRLFERGWMLRPMSDLGLYLAGMRIWADRPNCTALFRRASPSRSKALPESDAWIRLSSVGHSTVEPRSCRRSIG
jgi:hypothetical protein